MTNTKICLLIIPVVFYFYELNMPGGSFIDEISFDYVEGKAVNPSPLEGKPGITAGDHKSQGHGD